MLTALLLGVLFCCGNVNTKATYYPYDPNLDTDEYLYENKTYETIPNTESSQTAISKSNMVINNDIKLRKISAKTGSMTTSAEADQGFDEYIITGIPLYKGAEINNELLRILVNSNDADSEYDSELQKFNKKYGTNVEYHITAEADSPGMTNIGMALLSGGDKYYAKDEPNGTTSIYYYVKNFNKEYKEPITIEEKQLTDNKTLTIDQSTVKTKNIDVNNLTIGSTIDNNPKDTLVNVDGNIIAKTISIGSITLAENTEKISLNVKGTINTNTLQVTKGKFTTQVIKTNKIEAYDSIVNKGKLSLYIQGNMNIKGQLAKINQATTNTDVINKAQMTTALSNAKPKPGKTYNAGSGITLSTNNAIGLTNAAAYTTSDKKRISLIGAAKTYVKKVKTGKVSATSKDLINGSQLYAVQQSIAGFADRIQTNKTQLENLKSSINSKKEKLSSIQKNLNTIKATKLSQDMSNLTTDGEAVIKSQVKKAIQKFQKDIDVSTVQANVQEAKVTTAANALSSQNNEPSIMLADAPIKTTNEPVNAVSAISKEDVAAKADLSQTKVNLEKKATLDTMNAAAYTKQLSKGLATGESAYHALQEAKEDRLMQAKKNTLTVGVNDAETKIDASKKNWTGILVDEKEAGSMANVGYVDQMLSMESSYERLSLMKKDLEKDTNKGIAKAAAVAALKPIGNDEEDKVSFAIGYGHYKDGNAAAIGTFFRPNQDILIHLDVTAGAGKPSMNTGVSFKVGKGSNYASMTQEELAAENTAMKNQAEKQAERIHTQKEKIEHLESVMQSIRF